MSEKVFPLEGLKVVELSMAVAAPMAARMMATYGAEVIKIEAPPMGDSLRAMAAGQMQHDIEDGTPVFDTCNTGKKMIALNLKSESGIAALHRLLEDADVFITNTRMQSLLKLGLGYDDLKEKYPKLIYAHLAGHGLTGPRANDPGFDITAFWMLTGGATDTVEPDAYIVNPSFAFGDITSAGHLLDGILLALIGREKTGKGTMVSTSLFNTGMWCNSSFVIETQGATAKTFPVSHYDAWDPFSFQYKCKDGRWIAVMEKRWATDRAIFAEMFDMPELMTDPDLADLATVNATGKGRDIVAKVEKIMLTKTADEWKALLDEKDVANGIAQHYADIATDPQAIENGYVKTETYYGDQDFAIPTPPMVLTEFKRKDFEKPAPLGSDTVSVMKAAGWTDEQIEPLLPPKK